MWSCCGGMYCPCCDSQSRIMSPLAVVAVWLPVVMFSFQSAPIRHGRFCSCGWLDCHVWSSWCGCSRVAWWGRCAESAWSALPLFVCRVTAMLAAAAVVSMCVMSGDLKAMPVPLHSLSALFAMTVQLYWLQHCRPASSRMTS